MAYDDEEKKEDGEELPPEALEEAMADEDEDEDDEPLAAEGEGDDKWE